MWGLPGPGIEPVPPALEVEEPLEKGMAAHSSILTWRIPWTEEPGGLQSRVVKSQTQLSKSHFFTRRHQGSPPNANGMAGNI